MKKEQKEAIGELHKVSIIDVAEKLFAVKGIDKTTMDDIVKAAEYSKRTIYVYFKGKEEMYHHVILRGMLKLENMLRKALLTSEDFMCRYQAICEAMVKLHDENPLYFEGTIKANIMKEKETDENTVINEIWNVSEGINDILGNFFANGIQQGIVVPDIKIMPSVFVFWSSLTGVIKIAESKREYIQHEMNMTREAFLEYSFKSLIKTIIK